MKGFYAAIFVSTLCTRLDVGAPRERGTVRGQDINFNFSHVKANNATPILPKELFVLYTSKQTAKENTEHAALCHLTHFEQGYLVNLRIEQTRWRVPW